ncbi:MAG TPA: DUF1616 domain-containing protein, partial [Dehalococcoidia bacterium]|nr:DUF1616 domain-containing protein [Dehalococcoidia bacterium]
MSRKLHNPDLITVSLLIVALICAIFLFSVPWLRVILGFLFVAFIPGYSLLAVIFPRRNEISLTTKMALSIGLSIVISTLVGLILAFSPAGIELHSFLFAISAFVLILAGLAWYIRHKTGSTREFSISFHLALAGLAGLYRGERKRYFFLYCVLLTLILLSSASMGYLLARPAETPPSTEFYILGVNEEADDYPVYLSPGEKGEILVNIINRENQPMDYRLEIYVSGKKQKELFPIPLAPGEKWQRYVEF